MSEALEQLGLGPIYFGFTMFQNSGDLEMFLEGLDAKMYGKGQRFGRKEFDQLYGHYSVGS